MCIYYVKSYFCRYRSSSLAKLVNGSAFANVGVTAWSKLFQ